LIFSFLILVSFEIDAQSRRNDGKIMAANFSYSYHIPLGDLADRFGNNFSAGGGFDYITKNNFILGVQANVHFGNDVKENVLSTFTDSDPIIFGDFGATSGILLRERGLYLDGHIGKLFPLRAFNKRSGIRVTLGMGLFQHKIRIQDDPQVVVSSLAGDYKKGYDRLTNGLAITEFIGYQHFAKNRLINFYAGIELTQGFTQNRRDYNFDTFERDDAKRFDGLVGFKLGWVLPFYLSDNPDEIFY
jgi:hypothetical protein